MPNSFAKSEILKFAAFRQMLIARKPTPQRPLLSLAERPEIAAASPVVSGQPIHEH